MNTSGKNVRIGIAVAIILGTIGWLAYSGYGSSKSYYVTIAELGGMGDKAYKSNLRVEGFVQPGSIEQDGTHVTFVLNEFESHSPKAASGRLLKVSYKGSEPPPDTFKDDSQALAEGTYGRDGVLHATILQAKCASKYAPAKPGEAAAPANRTASMSNPAVSAPAN
jgi:cytochrome c-type biogenesis protein CcmE